VVRATEKAPLLRRAQKWATPSTPPLETNGAAATVRLLHGLQVEPVPVQDSPAGSRVVYLQEARVGALVKSRRLRGEGFATGGEMHWRRRFESRAEEPLAAYGQIPPSALAASRDRRFPRPGAAGTGFSGLDVSGARDCGRWKRAFLRSARRMITQMGTNIYLIIH
jgi:hypothetical protein